MKLLMMMMCSWTVPLQLSAATAATDGKDDDNVLSDGVLLVVSSNSSRW